MMVSEFILEGVLIMGLYVRSETLGEMGMKEKVLGWGITLKFLVGWRI